MSSHSALEPKNQAHAQHEQKKPSTNLPPASTRLSKIRFLKYGGLSAVTLAAAGVLLLSAGPNEAAACRGAGVVTAGPNGTIVTNWSDGAWKKQYSDGSYEWSTPAGSKPLPGTSPGHRPPQ